MTFHSQHAQRIIERWYRNYRKRQTIIYRKNYNQLVGSVVLISNRHAAAKRKLHQWTFTRVTAVTSFTLKDGKQAGSPTRREKPNKEATQEEVGRKFYQEFWRPSGGLSRMWLLQSPSCFQWFSITVWALVSAQHQIQSVGWFLYRPYSHRRPTYIFINKRPRNIIIKYDIPCLHFT